MSIGSTIGKVAQTKEKSTTNQQINAIEVNGKNNNNFIYSLLEKHSNNIRTGASTQAVPILNKTSFSLLEFNMPKIIEQEKIGQLFRQIDNLITLHHRKYTYIFYSWEQRKLKELVHSVGTGKSKYNLSDYNKYPVLGSRNIIGYDSSYDYSGDFILTARVGEYAGELYRYKGNVKITDNTVYLQGSDLDYLFYLLKKFNLKKLSFGSGQPLVKASELSNLDLFVSNNKTEKKKISELFNNLDNLITLHQHKELKRRNDNNEHLRW